MPVALTERTGIF